MIRITDVERPAGHPEPVAPPAPQTWSREITRAAHELQQVLGIAGLSGPTALIVGDRPRVRLDFIDADTADSLTLLIRKSMRRAFKTADELEAAFRAHHLEMPEPRVHQAKIHLGEISLPTADRLARLLGAPPEGLEPELTEWAKAQRILGRLGTAFKAATGGAFLDLVFHPDCLRCYGTAAVALGDIEVRTARKLVSVLQFGAWPVTTPPLRPDIARDLITRSSTARKFRGRLLRGPVSESEISLNRHFDHANGQVLRRLVSAHGWPGRRLIGEAGAEAAWQLALYADSLQDFQRLALRLLAIAVQHGEATVRQWAHLYDRCSINAGDAQFYGTQHRLGPTGVETLPIRDPEGLDARRSAVGLPPFRPAQPAVRLQHSRGSETVPAVGTPPDRVLVGATA